MWRYKYPGARQSVITPMRDIAEAHSFSKIVEVWRLLEKGVDDTRLWRGCKRREAVDSGCEQSGLSKSKGARGTYKLPTPFHI